MKFYIYYRGFPMDIQLIEDEIFEILQQYNGIIFARGDEDRAFLNGMKLMYGLNVPGARMPTASLDLVKRSNAKLLSRSEAVVASRSSSLTQDMLNSFFKMAFLRLQK